MVERDVCEGPRRGFQRVVRLAARRALGPLATPAALWSVLLRLLAVLMLTLHSAHWVNSCLKKRYNELPNKADELLIIMGLDGRGSYVESEYKKPEEFEGIGTDEEVERRVGCARSPYHDEKVERNSTEMKRLTRAEPRFRAALVTLVHGHETVDEYVGLRLWLNSAHLRMPWIKRYDVLLFHEGNVEESHVHYVRTGRVFDDETQKYVLHDQLQLDNKEFTNVRFVNLQTESDEAFRVPQWIADVNASLPVGYGYGYLHMCRFFTRLMFPLIWDTYDYVMRFDEDLQMDRSIRYDVFEYMHANDYKYAYGAEIPEWHEVTFNTFGRWVADYIVNQTTYKYPFAQEYNETELADLGKQIVFTNFFATRLDWWKQPHVRHFLDAVDATGNTYFLRWGDAPIHTAVLKLFADYCDVVPLCDVWYFHGSTTHGVKECRIATQEDFLTRAQQVFVEKTDNKLLLKPTDIKHGRYFRWDTEDLPDDHWEDDEFYFVGPPPPPVVEIANFEKLTTTGDIPLYKDPSVIPRGWHLIYQIWKTYFGP